MRIAIATPVYYPMTNGVAVFSRNLANGLRQHGNEVMVLTPSPTKRRYEKTVDGVRVSYLKSSTIKVYPDQMHETEGKKLFYKYGFKASLFPKKAIFRALDEFRPDVIHIQGSDMIGLAAVSYGRKHQIPVVSTEHNQPEVLTESLPLPGFLKGLVNGALTAYFVNRQGKSDYATMPTELSIKNLAKGRKLKAPVEAVSNGVDLKSFRPGKVADNIYNIYDIPKERPVVLYVGRLDPEKRIEVALQAFKEFLDKHKLDGLSKTLFLVVGDGVDKENLMNFVYRNDLTDAVKFLGRVMPPDLNEIYRLGDVFVTASEIETQGIVLIEAAASGLPLIAVDAGAVSEVCVDNRNGFLLKPGDAEAMSGAIEKILSDASLRKKMASESLKIAERHSLENTINKFLEIYKKLL